MTGHEGSLRQLVEPEHTVVCFRQANKHYYNPGTG